MSRTLTAAQQTALANWTLLQRTYLLAYKSIERAQAGRGVSQAQAAVLIALTQAGEPLPLSRLARSLVQEAQSVTSLVDRLEARGLVRRASDGRDRRVIKVALTDAGAALVAAALPAIADAAAAVFADIDEGEQATLNASLDRVRRRSAALLGLAMESLPTDGGEPAACDEGQRS